LKKRYRFIDFSRRLNSFGKVLKIVYDPNRNSFLGLILYENGFLSYIILSEDVVKGSRVYSGSEKIVAEEFDLENENFKGSAFPLKYMPLFSIVNNVEIKPFFGAQLARAAGSGLIIMGFENQKAILKSKSG
jgi:large subunit ribosomal protein L2